MFPSGRPGVALLLLRLAVAAGLCLMPDSGRALYLVLPSPLPLPVLSLLAAMLVLGLLTPLTALAVWVLGVLALRASVQAPLILIVLQALVLMLIGPGAYSVDARLFGRRKLVFEHEADDP